MCGIVGYVGHRNAAEIVLDGLTRLEYRGYDSAGLAVIGDRGLELRRAVGKIGVLAALVERDPVRGPIGLGHTRWATHGRPSEANAHPHVDCSGRLVVVHNGILENYLELRERLEAAGHRFRSETDTEVLSHLVEAHLASAPDLPAAVRAALREVRGAYAVGVLDRATPDAIVVGRWGAGGAIVGLGDGEAFVASDIPAILTHTRDVVVLEDGDVATVSATGATVTDLDGRPRHRTATRVTWSAAMAEKGGYRHFMLKEIHEQPRAVAETLAGRLDEETGALAGLDPALAHGLRRVIFVACGTSHHAALVGRAMVERLAGLPAEVDIASEFRYRHLVIGPETLVVAISQSGETADTLGAVKAARARGARVLGITNVAGSALSREATAVLPTYAGPEIGVASSKTFTATIAACYLLALSLGRRQDFLPRAETGKRLAEAMELPRLIERALGVEATVAALARDVRDAESFLFLGRGLHVPVALEGALKLKELSYIHAEGYAAGEMKHGPIALIDHAMPVVALAPRDGSYDRMLANIEEVKAREGVVIAVCHEGDTEVAGRADHAVFMPPAPELLAPMVSVIAMQFLAYHVATLRGLDVDQPRNLAKSVTVE